MITRAGLAAACVTVFSLAATGLASAGASYGMGPRAMGPGGGHSPKMAMPMRPGGGGWPGHSGMGSPGHPDKGWGGYPGKDRWANHPGFRHRWNRFGAFNPYAWGPAAFWVQPDGWNNPVVTVSAPRSAEPVPMFRLPTAADLPVAGVISQPPGPPTLYVLHDLTGGRSDREGGARVISVSQARVIGGGGEATASSAPRIIDLTAR